MAYVAIEDFRYGMDRRRKRVMGAPGTLWTAKNCHIGKGGDIERVKAFTEFCTLPEGTFGLVAHNSRLHVLGSSDLASSVPGAVTYHRLQLFTLDMDALLDTAVFGGAIYAVVSYGCASLAAFYDGSYVSDWQDVAAGLLSQDFVALALARRITDGGAVDVALDGDTLTLTAKVAGTGFAISVATEDFTTADGSDTSQNLILVEVAANAPGVKQVNTVEVAGTIEYFDGFRVTIDGVNYDTYGYGGLFGVTALTHKQRVWSAAGGVFRYCMFQNPNIWDPDDATTDNDAGFLDVSFDLEPGLLVGAAPYQNGLAVFGEKGIAIYSTDTNPGNISLQVPIDNSGSMSKDAIVKYGNTDVFYLDNNGIRSLRTVKESNTPFVADVGLPIDSFYKEIAATLTSVQIRNAKAVIEPVDGRLWVAVGEYIFVYSNFAAFGIQGWSYYDVGFEVDAFAVIGDKLYVRSGDTVYLYGGEDGTDYPGEGELEPLVELPFISAKKPATFKDWRGFDIACTNEWDIHIVYDPNDTDLIVNIGSIDEITFNELDTNLSAPAPVISAKFTCTTPGEASISSVVFHYDEIRDR